MHLACLTCPLLFTFTDSVSVATPPTASKLERQPRKGEFDIAPKCQQPLSSVTFLLFLCLECKNKYFLVAVVACTHARSPLALLVLFLCVCVCVCEVFDPMHGSAGQFHGRGKCFLLCAHFLWIAKWSLNPLPTTLIIEGINVLNKENCTTFLENVSYGTLLYKDKNNNKKNTSQPNKNNLTVQTLLYCLL